MTKHCGFIAVVGAPNVGKSTFINALVGQKVTIVSSRPNTTRNQIYGIVTQGDAQMILVDTPGLISQPEGTLHRYMTKSVWRGSRMADVCVVMMDAQKPNHRLTKKLIEELLQKEKRVFLVFNKVDAIAKEQLLPLAAQYQAYEGIEKFFMISVKKNIGVADVSQALCETLPEGEWLFSEDAVTQISQKLWAAEITREKIFQSVYQEVPYSVHVQTDLWYIPGKTPPPPQKTLPEKGLSIFQTILVGKEGHRKLIIGHKGSRLTHIARSARLELEEALQERVHLFLHIKVSPSWAEDPYTYKSLDASPF